MEQIKSLTSLRFLAAAGVVCYHSKHHFMMLPSLFEYFNAAHLVAFFFILSGFVLTLKHRNVFRGADSRKFYLTRLMRIWPAHVASLVLLLVLVPDVFDAKHANLGLFLSNLFMLQSWNLSPHVYFSYNSASWSNSTECFFYLLFPLLILGVNKKPVLTAIIVGMGVLCTILVACLTNFPHFDLNQNSSHGLLYVFPLTRLLEFYCGMLLAKVFAMSKRTGVSAIGKSTLVELGCLGLVLLAGAGSAPLQVLLTPHIGGPLAFWICNCGICLFSWIAMIYCFAHERGLVSRLLQNSVLVYLGEISFTIYMLHGVLLTWHGVYLPQSNTIFVALAFFAILLLLSHLVSFYFERPLRSIVMTASKTPFTGLPALIRSWFGRPHDAYGWYPMVWRSALVVGLVFSVLPHNQYLYAMPAVPDKASGQPLTLAPSLSASKQVPPGLELIDRTVVRTPDGLKVHLCWLTHNRMSVDFLESLIIFDDKQKVLMAQTHCSDVWKTSVDASTKWVEDFAIDLPASSRPASIQVALFSGKKPVAISLDTEKGPEIVDHLSLSVAEESPSIGSVPTVSK